VRVDLRVGLASFEVGVDVLLLAAVGVAGLFAVGVASGAVGMFVEEDEADKVADEAGTSNGEDEDGAGDDYKLGWESRLRGNLEVRRIVGLLRGRCSDRGQAGRLR
jgi:hypothetical protein